MCLWGEERGKKLGREWREHVPQSESMQWALCLEGFVSRLQAGVLVGVTREGFSRIFISFPDVFFQGRGLH